MLLLATSSAVETYAGQGGAVAARTHENVSSTLPFTGLDVAVTVGIAILLFAAAILLARVGGREIE